MLKFLARRNCDPLQVKIYIQIIVMIMNVLWQISVRYTDLNA